MPQAKVFFWPLLIKLIVYSDTIPELEKDSETKWRLDYAYPGEFHFYCYNSADIPKTVQILEKTKGIKSFKIEAGGTFEDFGVIVEEAIKVPPSGLREE